MLNQQSSTLPALRSNKALSLAVAHTPPRAEVLVDSVMRIIWKQRLLVVRVTALAIMLALVYLLFATPLYTVSARLLLQRNAPKFIRDGVVDQQVPDNNNFLFTQQQVITSTPVLATALGMPGVHDIKPLHGRSDALAILRRQVSVDVGKKDELLTVAFDAADPSEGALLVSAIVDSYTRFEAGLRLNNSSEMQAVLRDEKKAREAELETKTQELLAYRAEHGLSRDSDKETVTEKRVQSLSDALSLARLETVAAESAYAEVQRSLDADPKRAQQVDGFLKGTGSAMPSSSDDSIIRQEMMSLKAREIELRQRFMPSHPSVLAVEKRIDELDIAFAAGVKHRFDAAVDHEANLQRSFDEQQKISFELATRQAEYDRRKSEVGRLEKVIETLDTRLKEVALTEDGGVPSVTVLESARASDKPTHPDKARSLILAAFAGLLLGSCLAVGLDVAGRLPGNTFDVQLDFGLPVLGHLPMLTPEMSPVSHGQPMLIDTGSSIELLLRSLRETLSLAPTAGRGTTILVTSPGRSDGKSVLVSNLAIALAAERKRVLLVEADFRAPSLGRIFGLNSGTGLGTLLDTDDPLPVTAIHHTGTPYLDVILSGPSQRVPSDILNSQRFVDLLGDLAQKYDYLLLDAPPAFTHSDARTIAASCDATMLVVRAGRVNRDAFNRAREGLSDIGANVVGVVLNTGSDSLSTTVSHDNSSGSGRNGRLTRTLTRIGGADTRAATSSRVQPTNAA